MSQFVLTTATKKVLQLSKRIQGVAGGTSASKTISILMRLIDMAQSDTRPTLTSVTSESFPHLRRGALRDFRNIMEDRGYWQPKRWNKTESTYLFESGSSIEFFSADDSAKAHGPRRQRLFINEGNNIPWDTVDQMIVRTSELIVIDWNPTREFWWYTDIQPFRDHDFLTLTYKDNEALPEEIVKDIEAHRHNKNWWKVYGLGQLGEAEGMIFSNWHPIDEPPPEARLIKRGLDFGYTNHPTALVDVYKWNNSFILDEQIYQKGMSNQDIADRVLLLKDPQRLIVADAAEPKSIDELARRGLNVIAANKGPGSIMQGISFLQDQNIFLTKRSVNGWKEYRNYMWRVDKDGKSLNQPEDLFNHLMDAARYALEAESRRDNFDNKFNTGSASALIY